MSKPSNSEVISAIFEHFITDGNLEAAEVLVQEAMLSPDRLESVRLRKQVSVSIKAGDVQRSIALISEYDSQFLKEHPEVHFDLCLMHLIELIRESDFDADRASIDPALAFAKTQVLPLVEAEAKGSDSYTARMSRFQKVMALICLDPKKGLPPAIANLFGQDERDNLAKKVDGHFLQSENLDNISGLDMLVRMTDLIRYRFMKEGKGKKIDEILDRDVKALNAL